MNIRLEKLYNLFFIIIIILIYICKVVFDKSLFDNNKVVVSPSFLKLKTKVCTLVSEVELSSIVWSHKGSIKELDLNVNDASKIAIDTLIDLGIYRFDIDVCKVDYPSNSGIYVLHPKVIENDGSSFNLFNYLSIEEFLQVVIDKSIEKDCFSRIFITIEPKFEDPKLLSKLIQIISNSRLHDNAAIISSNYNTLSFIQNRIQLYDNKVGISLAYRNQPNYEVELFKWHNKSIIKEIHSGIRIMYMPDIKLLPKAKKDSFIIDIDNNNNSLYRPIVVAWIVG